MRPPCVWMCYIAKLLLPHHVSHRVADMQYNQCRLLRTYHFIGKHEDDLCLLLPDHLPEVSAGVLQWTLGHNELVHCLIHSELHNMYTRDYGVNK